MRPASARPSAGPLGGLIRRRNRRRRSQRPKLFYPIYIDGDERGSSSVGEPFHRAERQQAPDREGHVTVWPIRLTVRGTGSWLRVGLREAMQRGDTSSRQRRSGQANPIQYLTRQHGRRVRGLKVAGKGANRVGPRPCVRSDYHGFHPPGPSGTAHLTMRATGRGTAASCIPGAKFPVPEVAVRRRGRLAFRRRRQAESAHPGLLRRLRDDGARGDPPEQTGRRSPAVHLVTNNEVSADEAACFGQGATRATPSGRRLESASTSRSRASEAAITGETPDGERSRVDYKFATSSRWQRASRRTPSSST